MLLTVNKVLVISGVDTIGIIANPLTGEFTVGGLYEGNYSVLFVPVDGFNETKITDIKVINRQNTNLGTVTLESNTLK